MSDIPFRLTETWLAKEGRAYSGTPIFCDSRDGLENVVAVLQHVEPADLQNILAVPHMMAALIAIYNAIEKDRELLVNIPGAMRNIDNVMPAIKEVFARLSDDVVDHSGESCQ